MYHGFRWRSADSEAFWLQLRGPGRPKAASFKMRKGDRLPSNTIKKRRFIWWFYYKSFQASLIVNHKLGWKNSWVYHNLFMLCSCKSKPIQYQWGFNSFFLINWVESSNNPFPLFSRPPWSPWFGTGILLRCSSSVIQPGDAGMHMITVDSSSCN